MVQAIQWSDTDLCEHLFHNASSVYVLICRVKLLDQLF